MTLFENEQNENGRRSRFSRISIFYFCLRVLQIPTINFHGDKIVGAKHIPALGSRCANVLRYFDQNTIVGLYVKIAST